MRDYFAALAARTLQPELGVQPRARVRWEDAPEPPVDAFAAISHDAIAVAARRVEPAERERHPRSRRRPHAEAGPPGDEQATPRKRTANRDEPTIPAIAAVRAAEPALPIRRERVPGSGHAPVITSPAIGNGRAPVVPVSPAPERALHVPTRLSGRHRESAAPEPTVRIHIGRVDVRAVTAAASGPSASKASKRALMSLDEYVQKRDGGVS